jgi:3-hydroxyacyl-[acyl-carrier-protein] dehydratase
MTEENWHAVKHVDRTDTGEMKATVEIGPDSCWFSGHFPGEPILPGIAQLAMVYEALRVFLGEGVKISGVRQVRFKQMIRPDDIVTILASPHKERPKTYVFRIMTREGLACKGTIFI